MKYTALKEMAYRALTEFFSLWEPWGYSGMSAKEVMDSREY